MEAAAVRMPTGGLGYSLRRYYIDEFFARQAPRLPAGGLVLDLGGNKTAKRGHFNIERYPIQVVYANFVTAKRPDVQADAAILPFREGCFDSVVCAELLEHVADPPAVLREVRRVLKDGGILLITVPFLYPIHADPSDFGRYTDFYWRTALTSAGFRIAAIERQGLFWSVLVDLWRAHVNAEAPGRRLRERAVLKLLAVLATWAKRAAVRRDHGLDTNGDPVGSRGSFTTGFGIVAIKNR